MVLNKLNDVVFDVWKDAGAFKNPNYILTKSYYLEDYLVNQNPNHKNSLTSFGDYSVGFVKKKRKKIVDFPCDLK